MPMLKLYSKEMWTRPLTRINLARRRGLLVHLQAQRLTLSSHKGPPTSRGKAEGQATDNPASREGAGYVASVNNLGN